jgi:hypothetical protein
MDMGFFYVFFILFLEKHVQQDPFYISNLLRRKLVRERGAGSEEQGFLFLIF